MQESTRDIAIQNRQKTDDLNNYVRDQFNEQEKKLDNIMKNTAFTSRELDKKASTSSVEALEEYMEHLEKTIAKEVARRTELELKAKIAVGVFMFIGTAALALAGWALDLYNTFKK